GRATGDAAAHAGPCRRRAEAARCRPDTRERRRRERRSGAPRAARLRRSRPPPWRASPRDRGTPALVERWRRPTWLGLSVLGDIFVQAEDVAFRVLKPRSLFRAEHGHVIDCLEARQVIVVEHDTH